MVLLVLALCLVGVAAAHAAEDAFIGTWKLDEAKSKLGAGAPKNSTVVYEMSGDSVKVTIDGTDANRGATHTEWTGKFDGKNYPVTGSSSEDTRAVKKINDHTLSVTVTKGGKITETGHVVVAADGKSRTVTTHGTDTKGMKVTTTTVYDKQ